jgi:hypothetical protein
MTDLRGIGLASRGSARQPAHRVLLSNHETKVQKLLTRLSIASSTPVQIEAGHMDIESIPFNVRKEMEVVGTLFMDKARQKRLDFVILVQVRFLTRLGSRLW